MSAPRATKRARLYLRRATIALAALLLLTASASAGLGGAESGGAQPNAVAAPNAGYALSRWTVDGGGASSVAGGKYTLGGTAGQPDAGVLGGGTYTLDGGFWGGSAVAVKHYTYLPLVLR